MYIFEQLHTLCKHLFSLFKSLSHIRTGTLGKQAVLFKLNGTQIFADILRCSKQGIYKGGHRASFGEDDQQAQKEQHEHNGEKPVTFSYFQEFPEFTNEKLVRHDKLLKIVL